MRKITLLFFIIVQVCVAQTNNVNQLLIDGEKAYLESDFLLAKEIYTKITIENPKNKDGWFNRAAVELKLGDNETACEDFYQAYLLNDGEAQKIIQENCSNFRNGLIMSLKDVEEKPKFLYGRKEYLFFENNSLNPKFLSILKTRFKWSPIMSKYKGRIYIQFQIDRFNKLDASILKVSGNQKDAEIVKKELLSIFDDIVVYVSAKNNGVNVDLWDKWSQIFDFIMVSSK
ncbi:hypothetical protein NYQ10_11520 [Flavobacterium johnsoniae]|uniref:hypothetical protein n=1 Tax=Flavobacterium johnsoniae TaxID=986 RepID=UPI0025B0E105|nr:hypothetical protein [Flavobacterium johnsoniae]WJS97061.1 hypothetical protein NYQ10_11520 [Flavobacterium johnsoniae]